MRAAVVAALVLGALVLAFWLTGRPRQTDDADQGSGRPPDGELSLTHPGDHDLRVAQALAPRVTILRSADGWLGRAEARPPDDAATGTIEVLDPGGRLIASGEDAAAGVEFQLPLDFKGPLLARVRYASGEVWRQVVRL